MEPPQVTTEKIIAALSDKWQPITSFIFKMKIKDMMDARFLQIKLKGLERKGLVLAEIKMGKKHWKLPGLSFITEKHDTELIFDSEKQHPKIIYKNNLRDLEDLGEITHDYYIHPESEHERLVDLDPFDEEAWLGLGDEFMDQENLEMAINSYKNASRLASDELNTVFFIKSLNKLGNAYHKNGKYQQALESLNEGLKIAREENQISLIKLLLRDIGNVYYDDSKYEEAIEYYEHALELSTIEGDSLFNREIMFNLGTSYEINNQPDDAIACFEKILEYNSKIDIVWSSLGLIYKAKKEYKKAKKSFETALDLNPNDEKLEENLKDTISEMEKDNGKVSEELPDEVEGENIEGSQQDNIASLLKEQNSKFDELIDNTKFAIKIQIKSYINELIKPFFDNPSTRKIKKLKKSIEEYIGIWPKDNQEDIINEYFRTIKRYEEMQPSKWKKWGSHLIRLISVLR